MSGTGLGYQHRGEASASCAAISGCTGTGFAGICESDGNSVTKVIVTNAGEGYSANALPSLSCAGGSGQSFTPSLGHVTSIHIVKRGFGYSSLSPPRISCQGGSGQSFVPVLDAQSALPLVRCPGGSGQIFTATLGSVSAIRVLNAGSGYLRSTYGVSSIFISGTGSGYLNGGAASASCEGVPGCTGRGFSGTCTSVGGQVSDISITSQGVGFSTSFPPRVSCEGGTGQSFKPTIRLRSTMPTITCPGLRH